MADYEQPQVQIHVPVLYEEVLDALRPRAGGRYLDGTVGAGGHAEGILRASAPDGRLLALDRDPAAIDFARQRLAGYVERLQLVNASFADMESVAHLHGFEIFDGILLDLGLSSRQLADPARGFSFQQDGPLDMRFDPRGGRTAADLINDLGVDELADIIYRYGEEQQSRRIARLIVAHRPIETTAQLADLIAGELGRRRGPAGRLHPATKTFQALRIAVNEELAIIERGLQAAVRLLTPEGRLVVISFHSLEDRLVKQFFRQMSRDCICPPEQPLCTCGARPTLRLIGRKAIKASAEEIATNPRSRSARLRAAARTAYLAE